MGSLTYINNMDKSSNINHPEWYNKNHNPLQYDSPDISYKEIEYCTLLYMDYDTIINYFDFFSSNNFDFNIVIAYSLFCV